MIGASAKPSTEGETILRGLIFWFSAFLSLTAILDYRNAHLILTNKRILFKAGYARKLSLEMLLNKVQGIDIDQSLLGRMLNYGVITIKGEGINNIKIKNIREPYAFREKVQNIIEGSKETK